MAQCWPQIYCWPCRNKRTALLSKTQTAVNLAILRGDLVRQPCEVCGKSKGHAHHDDYSQPLKVRWLCPAHHRQHHARVAERPIELGAHDAIRKQAV